MSGFLKLNIKDLGKGLVVAVLVTLFAALQQALTKHGVDVQAYDWSGIWNVVWLSVTGYLSKNLLSDQEGKFGGIVG